MRHSPCPTQTPVVLDARVVTGAGGGPEKTILHSPRYLAAAGYRMVCAYLRSPNDPGFATLRQRARESDAPLVEIDDRGPLDWRVLGALLDVCRRERVAIWHGHEYKSNLLGLLLRPLWPMRLVTTVHGWVQQTQRTPLYYAIDRLCLPRYERVICVSTDLHDECLKRGVRPERCLLIENGVDTATFSRRRDRAEAKRPFGVPAERFLIGAAGRLSAEKGFDVLIRAVAGLLREGADVQLLLAGDGDQKTALQALIAELGCAERVQLLGHCADMRALFEALDVFALSSRREGLPNVVLEALAMEVPVVATRIAGVPRLIRHEENGLLVEPEACEALQQALARLASDAGLRARLAQAGRQTVESSWSFAARMQKIAALYDMLLQRTPACALSA
jgi:glycosyltransferase involved in cell wall biosynthesis